MAENSCFQLREENRVNTTVGFILKSRHDKVGAMKVDDGRMKSGFWATDGTDFTDERGKAEPGLEMPKIDSSIHSPIFPVCEIGAICGPLLFPLLLSVAVTYRRLASHIVAYFLRAWIPTERKGRKGLVKASQTKSRLVKPGQNPNKLFTTNGLFHFNPKSSQTKSNHFYDESSLDSFQFKPAPFRAWDFLGYFVIRCLGIFHSTRNPHSVIETGISIAHISFGNQLRCGKYRPT